MTILLNEDYIFWTQRVLGDMFDFAVNTLGYELEKFHKMFIASGMSFQYENNNPAYVYGKTGCEVAREVISDCGLEPPEVEDVMYLDKSEEYWVGWALGAYQCISGKKYAQIEEAVPIVELYAMYDVFHEEDIIDFIEVMNEKMKDRNNQSQLKRLRSYAGLTQKMLSMQSGVELRQIQLLEQNQRDINKSQFRTVELLARTIGCDISVLAEHRGTTP